jgi:hypothetical protein
MFFVLDQWSSAPVAYSPIQIFNIGHDYALWIRNFMVMKKNPRTSILRLPMVQWPTAIIRPKSRNSNIRHDGILSIGNFMLMINNRFTRFQLPGNLLKTRKMCFLFSWQHAISYLFFFFFVIKTSIWFFYVSTHKNRLKTIVWIFYIPTYEIEISDVVAFVTQHHYNCNHLEYWITFWNFRPQNVLYSIF